MNVFYDFQIFALQRHGGISRYFLSLWQEFLRTGGPDCELFLGMNRTGLDAEIDRLVQVGGFRVKDPMLLKTWRVAWLFNARLCPGRLRRSRTQIYHPTYFWLPEKVAGKALVVTVYDLIHELFPELCHVRDPAFRWRPEAIRRADVILAISETTKRDLCERYKVPPEKVFVTPLGCSMPRIESLPSLATSGKPGLLYVGERGSYKNFAVLAAAWRQSERLRRGFRLVCFGGAAPSADERGLPGDVEFRRGDDLALAQAYREAAALVYPSLYEGFGLPLLEAFHFGCPVVTSGCGSIREVAGDAAAYFEAGSPESLLAALAAATEDTARRAELVAHGRVRQQAFSWARCAALTREGYAAALASRS